MVGMTLLETSDPQPLHNHVRRGDMRRPAVLWRALVAMCVIWPASPMAWDGSVRANAGAWTDVSSADGRDARYPLSALIAAAHDILGHDVRVRVEGWVGNRDFFARDSVAVLREGFAQVRIAEATVSVGRLIEPWGRADEINPTDSLVSRDWRLR